MEASLDHIDDELFANLVSRVSYLKMRREWERESGGKRIGPRPAPAHDLASKTPPPQDERAAALLQVSPAYDPDRIKAATSRRLRALPIRTTPIRRLLIWLSACSDVVLRVVARRSSKH